MYYNYEINLLIIFITVRSKSSVGDHNKFPCVCSSIQAFSSFLLVCVCVFFSFFLSFFNSKSISNHNAQRSELILVTQPCSLTLQAELPNNSSHNDWSHVVFSHCILVNLKKSEQDCVERKARAPPAGDYAPLLHNITYQTIPYHINAQHSIAILA